MICDLRVVERNTGHGQGAGRQLSPSTDLRCHDRVKAHIFVSWLHQFKEQKLIVVGDRKMAVSDDMERKDKLLYPRSINWKENVPVGNKMDAQPVELDQGEPLRAECRHFLDCVATRTKSRTDGEEGLRVLSEL